MAVLSPSPSFPPHPVVPRASIGAAALSDTRRALFAGSHFVLTLALPSFPIGTSAPTRYRASRPVCSTVSRLSRHCEPAGVTAVWACAAGTRDGAWMSMHLILEIQSPPPPPFPTSPPPPPSRPPYTPPRPVVPRISINAAALSDASRILLIFAESHFVRSLSLPSFP